MCSRPYAKYMQCNCRVPAFRSKSFFQSGKDYPFILSTGNLPHGIFSSSSIGFEAVIKMVIIFHFSQAVDKTFRHRHLKKQSPRTPSYSTPITSIHNNAV